MSRRLYKRFLCEAVWFSLTPLLLLPVVAVSQTTPRGGEAAVAGAQLTRDGRPWIPHGFHQIAFAVAPKMLQDAPPFFRVASENYTPQEYSGMKAHGADSVRIQVAQNGIDPAGEAFTPDFRDKVIGAVRSARETGLTVIISIQNEKQTGEMQMPSELPSKATERVWKELVPIFGQDRGVIFELFNEPRITPTPKGGPTSDQWRSWAEAMNRMIDVVRTLGAANVVVADGLQFAETLHGAPELNDPLQQVVYASHPYAHTSEDQTEDAWKRKFGEYSRKVPVIISEWGIGYYCDIHTPKATEQFLQYLQDHRIGLEIVAWDWQSSTFGSFNYDFPDPKVSSFEGGVCQGRDLPAGFGPGKMVERWYKTGSPAAAPPR